jgi:hypothetical protein
MKKTIISVDCEELTGRLGTEKNSLIGRSSLQFQEDVIYWRSIPPALTFFLLPLRLSVSVFGTEYIYLSSVKIKYVVRIHKIEPSSSVRHTIGDETAF